MSDIGSYRIWARSPRDGACLVEWFKIHGNDDLFSWAAKKREPRTVAVIDANVFFDLAEAEERSPNESRALLADWVRVVLELRITGELFEEISRHGDHEVRRRNLEFARNFDVLGYETGELQEARRLVAEVLPRPCNDRDRSDREHLAMCIAARVSYFVTRDDLLREFADQLWERARVEVLRPSEIVADLDEVERAEAYRPARFAGTRMALVPAKDLPEERVADTFRGAQRRTEFLFDADLARLDLFGAQPHLALSRENVYYRAPTNPRTLPSPARLLWYVSSDSRKPGTKAIRACSRLVDVTVGSPKLAYRAGRRLGVYEWKDGARVASKTRNGLVQSLRFRDTECFPAPVPLERVRGVLKKVGAETVNSSFPGPQRIPESAFAAIYSIGRGQEGDARVR